jgi:hypothetical protein
MSPSAAETSREHVSSLYLRQPAFVRANLQQQHHREAYGIDELIHDVDVVDDP